MTQQDVPAPINPGRPVTRDDLIPGRLIVRWTVTGKTRVIAPMPCHDRQYVTADPTRGDAVAICRACGASYDLHLQPDCEGGHWAEYTFRYRPYLLSNGRRS